MCVPACGWPPRPLFSRAGQGSVTRVRRRDARAPVIRVRIGKTTLATFDKPTVTRTQLLFPSVAARRPPGGHSNLVLRIGCVKALTRKPVLSGKLR